ncbi:MAG: ABC transporter ATP-binding protein [Thermoguttaceae bacterium]
MIHFEDVSKTYSTADGPVHALSGVNMDVGQREFIAVRGPSGCGKSTLLMLAGGLGTATSGRVSVAGEDLTAAGPAALARFRAKRIGFVFQMFHLLPYLTVLDNVAAASTGEQSTARARAAELLEKFHLTDRLRHRPAELSAGERQRVAMARALINGPTLILADEPTGNLDPGSATIVLDLLADFHREGGTVLLVTHEEQAAAYAGRTILLRQGTIEGDATASSKQEEPERA